MRTRRRRPKIPSERQPQYRLIGKRDHREIIFKGENLQDEWYVDEELQLLVRFHHQPRDWLFSPDEASADCPIEQEHVGHQRRTFGKYVNTGKTFQVNDNWYENIELETMTSWTGRTEFDIVREKPVHARDPAGEEPTLKKLRKSSGEKNEEIPSPSIPDEENEYEPEEPLAL